MAGGKKNIKPEDGRQFSEEYQPEEKWTEARAELVGEDLITWMKEDDTNIFFQDFLMIENDYYPSLISYLEKKFTSFSKLIERAKKIQEIKLMKFGVLDRLNATMTKFTLSNNHGWKERSENENLNKGDGLPPVFNFRNLNESDE